MQNVFQRVRRLACRVSICSFVALGSAAGVFCAASAAAAQPSLLVQNLLAQQGLAIGLLHTMVWGELTVGFGQHRPVGTCVPVPLGGEGSQKTLTRTGGGNNFTVEVYYDGACTNLYLHAVLKAAGGNPTTAIRFTETLTYYGVSGVKLGVAQITQRIGNSPQGSHFSQISDIGTFTPVNGGLPVQFGVDCSEPAGEPATAEIRCDVGVAQSVPMLNEDVASLTPVSETLTQISGAEYSGEFSAKNSKLVRGSNLDISGPTTHSLAITGTSERVGTSTANGSVGLVSPFLGSPAQWTVNDAGHRAQLTITFHDGATPFFSGAIRRPGSSANVATVRLDIGGNGFVRFSNNKKVKVSNWMMVN